MTLTIAIPSSSINSLDLSPASTTIDKIITENNIASNEQQLRLDIQYELESGDPRELSEVPEIRLWYIRLDAKYPWLPFLLDWQSGEFIRYAAMLVPHQFSSKEGIQYNPEALEIFLMQKTFLLKDWLEKYNIPSQSRIKSMAKLLGYDLDDQLFAML
ncbi:MAG: CRR6 family NdhI maturation factor [Cyanobacteria bacterium J06629_18]